MRKKVQSSTGSENFAGVETDLKRKTARKPKADAKPKLTGKPRAAEKPKTIEKPRAATKSKSTDKVNSAEKPKAAAKSKSAAKPNETDKPKANAKSKNSKANSAKSTKPNTSKKGTAENDESHEQRIAVKTPQVMKLVEYSEKVNPVLLAGKSLVPMQLRGKQSLTKLMRREMGEEFFDVEDTVVVNITELAIEHEAPRILDRFNACSCDKCVEVFSRKIAERVPVRFARVNKDGRGIDNRELSERVAPMRKTVITEMIKELIGSKKRCFHDDTE